MQVFCETPRLILREIVAEDAPGLFLLDSDPRVHAYLGNHPIHTMEEALNVVDFIREQYISRGIGRWAVIEKSSGEFIGWSGIKFILEDGYPRKNFYEVGYRFRYEFWGKGYATESAMAARDYAFHHFPIDILYSMANVENLGSLNVLAKCGFEKTERFIWEAEKIETQFLELTRKNWELGVRQS